MLTNQSITTIPIPEGRPTLSPNIEPQDEPVDWSTYAVTLRYSDQEILRDAMKLYNGDKPFTADVTYSKGAMWKGLAAPALKFDLFPQSPDVVKTDCRDLPLLDCSIDSIVFDPPFVMKDTTNRVPNGIIETRFSGYKDAKTLWGFYGDSLREFYRVLEIGGIVAFKCQDVVSSGRQWWSHIEVYRMAIDCGFVAKDLFVKGRKSIMWTDSWKNQQHAKKNHCFWWIFKKGGR